MPKKIILYNLADNVTEKEFKEYVTREKGPLISSLPGVKKYELVKVTGAMGGKIPYKYVGIVHVTSLEEYDQKATKTQKYQDFLKKFGPMAKDLIMLSGEEIY
ncbi:MAG: REDY-like protein HapK [Chloroflexi bacterium]|nr:REDY-like protein HapK [Chloroflexota bacterium]